MLVKVKYKEIVNEGLTIINEEGESITLEGDIVVAASYTPNKELYIALQGKVPELYQIGDCVETRKIMYAIHEGAAVGQKICIQTVY